MARTIDYVTVDEAAALLRVAPSTVRRWIRAGALPAARIGPRRLALKRTDLARMVRPVGDDRNEDAAELEQLRRRRLTPEEQARGLAAIERIRELRRKILEERGGIPFSPSWELINEARDERTRQLA